jgi:hypothetical protein
MSACSSKRKTLMSDAYVIKQQLHRCVCYDSSDTRSDCQCYRYCMQLLHYSYYTDVSFTHHLRDASITILVQRVEQVTHTISQYLQHIVLK